MCACNDLPIAMLSFSKSNVSTVPVHVLAKLQSFSSLLNKILHHGIIIPIKLYDSLSSRAIYSG